MIDFLKWLTVLVLHEYIWYDAIRKKIRNIVIEKDMIIMIMYFETFKTVVIAFNGDMIMCLMSHWSIIVNIRVGLFTLTISLGEFKRKMTNLQIKENISLYTRHVVMINALIFSGGEFTWHTSIVTSLWIYGAGLVSFWLSEGYTEHQQCLSTIWHS